MIYNNIYIIIIINHYYYLMFDIILQELVKCNIKICAECFEQKYVI